MTTNIVRFFLLSIASILVAACAGSPSNLVASQSVGEWREVPMTAVQEQVLNDTCFSPTETRPASECQALIVAIAKARRNAEAYAALPNLTVERLADGDDKVAQYELGKRLVAGEVIERDFTRARDYLSRAARSGRTRRNLYTPGGGGSSSSVTTVSVGTGNEGLVEAKKLLGRLVSGEAE